jgi:16S rRNA G966 N2-methylase RsmD
MTDPLRRAIEDAFPVVDINRLAVPERNAFKPVYQMHRWFARRASCVFRAILIGSSKPSGTDVMADFYRDHIDDPDMNGKVVLDPFMGGGTTVVEALRLGYRVVGIDLNPVAWFIVKTEVEPVDEDALKAAFERLAQRPTASGRALRDDLLSHYKTTCPCCASMDADIVYTFWVRSGVCPVESCQRQVPLYRDRIVAQRAPSVRYWRDAKCTSCEKTFDWETDPAVLVGEPSLRVASPTYSAGVGRTTARWAFSACDDVECPWCHERVRALPASAHRERKKVPLTVLHCPKCESVWQWRGDLPEEVDCPACSHHYMPLKGDLPDDYDFICSCGTRSRILDSLRRLPAGERRRLRAYAIAGYCATCERDTEPDEDEDNGQEDIFEGRQPPRERSPARPAHECVLSKSKGRFFRRIVPEDVSRYQDTCERWEREKLSLPHPQQEIPHGYQTVVGNDLPGHGFSRWQDLFNPRQLLCLSTLLKAIDEESDRSLRELLLLAFSETLRHSCLLCTYDLTNNKLRALFARKDFAPPKTPLENNVWGRGFGLGSFKSVVNRVIKGKAFCHQPFDRRVLGVDSNGKAELENVPSQELALAMPEMAKLYAQSSTTLDTLDLGVAKVDLVITDPPYADNVNYSEAADFFYVWLRLSLKKYYPYFLPEFTPKADEIIAQETRGRSMEDFQNGLARVFALSADRLKDDGLLVFTFHHEANAAWEAVLGAILEAGFVIEAVYPCESETKGVGSMGAQKIAYDLIHVCSKRHGRADGEKRSWAGVRQEIRRRAREEITAIEGGRYGNAKLPPADVNIILIGKCLELYARHYGKIVDHEDNPVSLPTALEEIRMMVDQLVNSEQPLPTELTDIDPESYVYFTCLCDRKEVKADEVHKATRGIIEPDALAAAGLLTRGRARRARTFEVKQPRDRLDDLLTKFKGDGAPQEPDLFGQVPTPKARGRSIFVDRLHLLMGLAEAGDNLLPWLERFRGEAPQIRAACDFVAQRNAALAPTLKKVRDLLDVGPLFRAAR